MRPDVRRLLSELTAVELWEWQVYFADEPFREQWADARHDIACYLAAVHKLKNPEGKSYKPKWTREKPVSPLNQREAVRQAAADTIAWARSCGAEEVKHGS